MIEFSCKNCGSKLNVEDKHSGKRVKCPKCGEVGVVPDKSDKIRFHCENCGQSIRVPQSYAGKTGKCPKCKNPVVVPSWKKPPPEAADTLIIACSMCEKEIKVTENSRGQVVECPECGCYVEVPSEEIPLEETATPAQTRRDDGTDDEQREEPHRPKGQVTVEESAPPGSRTLPWPIDILLYPASSSGLATIGGFAILPVVSILVLAFAARLCCLLPFLIVVGIFFVALYVYWYFCECIRDSAFGGVRAPRGAGESMDWGDLLWSSLRLLACYFFFFGPLIIYRYSVGSKAEANYVVVFSLLAYAVFFYPMGILAVVMFESVRGLNPIFILRSVAVTFLPYCGLVVLFYGLGVLFEMGILGSLFAVRGVTGDSLASALLFIVLMLAGFLWGLLVTGHLLGRFYWRYQEKLYWNA